MANYDWRDYRDKRWVDRFPEDARGYAVWRQQQFEPRFDLKALATRVFEARQRAALPSRPCVFVSHREADATEATRIAYLACQQGFEYWLDVLDPTLSGTAGISAAPTSEQSAAATAAVIEMALLNSSHVVAVMTPNTRGSQWVPYEYGRVKAPQTMSLQAACWVDKAVATAGLPEYLYLGAILKSEPEIQQWLKTEFQRHSGHASVGTCGWKGLIPASL